MEGQTSAVVAGAAIAVAATLALTVISPSVWRVWALDPTTATQPVGRKPYGFGDHLRGESEWYASGWAPKR